MLAALSEQGEAPIAQTRLPPGAAGAWSGTLAAVAVIGLFLGSMLWAAVTDMCKDRVGTTWPASLPADPHCRTSEPHVPAMILPTSGTLRLGFILCGAQKAFP